MDKKRKKIGRPSIAVIPVREIAKSIGISQGKLERVLAQPMPGLPAYSILAQYLGISVGDVLNLKEAGLLRHTLAGRDRGSE